jgi:hypothetical protein
MRIPWKFHYGQQVIVKQIRKILNAHLVTKVLRKQTFSYVFLVLLALQGASCISIKKYEELEKTYKDQGKKNSQQVKDLRAGMNAQKEELSKKIAFLQHENDSMRKIRCDTVKITLRDIELEKKYQDMTAKYEYTKNLLKKVRTDLGMKEGK